MVMLPPEQRCRTGGGGTVVEVLLALATVASAALAALVVARPGRESDLEVDSAQLGERRGEDPDE